MKNRSFILSTIGLVSLAIAATPIQQAYAKGHTAQTAQTAKWNYQCIRVIYVNGDVNESSAASVKTLGNEGFELVGTSGDYLWFKKPE